jgi:hypothetical protein
MSQNTSVESSTRSSPDGSINPVLQAALGSLDVQLEEELARYRRQKSGRAVMSPRGLGRHQTRKPLELIPVDKERSQTQPLALGMATAPAIASLPLALGNQTPMAAPSNETERELMTQPGQLDAFSSNASGLAIPTTDNSASEESRTKQPNPPETSANVDGDLANLPADSEQPEDYLESSEKLLQSLAEDKADIHSVKRSTNRLLVPLSVGSILLLLVSIATVGYIFKNPTTLNVLGLDRFFGSKTPTTAQSPTQTNVATDNRAKDSPIVNGPNLASDEFVDLNLNTLSHLEASPTPSVSMSPIPSLPELSNPQVSPTVPSVVPNSALPRRSSDLPSALIPPALQPGTAPPAATQPAAPLPAPTASASRAKTSSSASGKPKPSSTADKSTGTKKTQVSPSPAQVATSTAPREGSYYYVLSNYSSDRDLEQLKKIVPDAYVENYPQGSRIQLGAFQRESEAKTLVAELKQQGIAASIYRP